MMLIEASCPSNKLAAVTKRSLRAVMEETPVIMAINYYYLVDVLSTKFYL